MGTSAIAEIKYNGEIVSNILVSSDGYLGGFGNTLLEVLKRKHVNGYSNDQTQYNRVGNFVALVVAKLVIASTDSENRVNEYFKKPKNEDLSCGGVEIISNEKSKLCKPDYNYLIEFNCDLDDPKPPTIQVSSYGFVSEKLTVLEFSDLIESGLTDDED